MFNTYANEMQAKDHARRAGQSVALVDGPDIDEVTVVSLDQVPELIESGLLPYMYYNFKAGMFTSYHPNDTNPAVPYTFST